MRILSLIATLIACVSCGSVPARAATSTAQRTIVTTTDVSRKLLTNETVAAMRSYLALSTVGTNVYPFNTNQFDVSNTNEISIKTNLTMYDWNLHALTVSNLYVPNQNVGYVMSLDVAGMLQSSTVDTNTLRMTTELLTLTGLTNRGLFGEVWVAVRTDGVDGVGSYLDPRDASTAAKLSNVVSGVTNTMFHFLPGTYTTDGQLLVGNRTQWRGAGMDVTKFVLATNAPGSNIYMIRNASTSQYSESNLFFSDFTIDGNAVNHTNTNSSIHALVIQHTNLAGAFRLHVTGCRGGFQNGESFPVHFNNGGYNGGTNWHTNASFATIKDCVLDNAYATVNQTNANSPLFQVSHLTIAGQGLIDGCVIISLNDTASKGIAPIGISLYGSGNSVIQNCRLLNVSAYADSPGTNNNATRGIVFQNNSVEMQGHLTNPNAILIGSAYNLYLDYKFLGNTITVPTNNTARHISLYGEVQATNSGSFRAIQIRGNTFRTWATNGIMAGGGGTYSPIFLRYVTNALVTDNLYEDTVTSLVQDGGTNAGIVLQNNHTFSGSNLHGNTFVGAFTNLGSMVVTGAVNFTGSNHFTTATNAFTNAQDTLLLLNSNGAITRMTRSNFLFDATNGTVYWSTNLDPPYHGTNTSNYSTATSVLPTNGNIISFPHTLGRNPRNLEVGIFNLTNDAGWSPGTYFPLTEITYVTNIVSIPNYFRAYHFSADSNAIYIIAPGHTATNTMGASGAFIGLPSPSGAVLNYTNYPMNRTNWRVRIYAQ